MKRVGITYKFYECILCGYLYHEKGQQYKIGERKI